MRTPRLALIGRSSATGSPLRVTTNVSPAVTASIKAELAAGPHLALDPVEAKRQARLQEVESALEPIPVDAAAARSYGLLVAAAVREGRKPESRFADLLIAATAHASRLDLYTRNAEAFTGLEGLVRVFNI